MTKTISDYLGARNRYVREASAVEIEACFNDQYDFDEWSRSFHTTSEGSLRGYGTEFVLSNPAEKEKVLSRCDNLFSHPRWDCYTPSTRAGTHIHENFMGETMDYTLRFLALYWFIEPLVVKRFGGPEREENLFCLQLHQADSLYNAIKKLVDRDFGYLRGAYNTYKYSACNFCSLANLGTIEFRFLPTVPNTSIIAPMLEFITFLREETKKYGSIHTLVEQFQEDYEEKVRDLLQRAGFPSEFYTTHLDLCNLNTSYVFSLPSLAETSEIRSKYSSKTIHTRYNPIYSFPSSEQEVDNIY